MKWRRYRRSLQVRLIVGMSALLLPLLLISSLHAYWSARRTADIAYDRSLLLAARSLAEGLHDSEGQLLLHIPYLALDNFAWDSSGQIYYQIVNEKGRVLSGYEDLPAPPADTALTADYPALARFYDAQYQQQSVRVISLLQAETNGMLEIRLAETRSARQRLAERLVITSLWHLGLLSISAVLLCLLAVRLALRPLHALKQALGQRHSSDLRPLARAAMPREILPLVNALNRFHHQLRHVFRRQRRFISDAAHELRTPLTALKAQLELGLRSRHSDDWRDALCTAEQQSTRLITLANQLLSLARIESGAYTITEDASQAVDLSQLTREMALLIAPLAHQRQLYLELEAEQAVWIRGESGLLSELINNLLDNALKYARHRVIVRVLPNAVLEIEDDGPGLPETDYDNVFQRFWQQQTDSSSNHHGSGLGLAIAREICRAHHAHIHLRAANPQGLIVSISFAT